MGRPAPQLAVRTKCGEHAARSPQNPRGPRSSERTPSGVFATRAGRRSSSSQQGLGAELQPGEKRAPRARFQGLLMPNPEKPESGRFESGLGLHEGLPVSGRRDSVFMFRACPVA